jgi:putative DNA primase/helicase
LLLNCRAGCDQAAVIDALKERGLWQVGPGPDRSEHVYDYRDEHGALRYQVVRRPVNGASKKFLQRRPDGAGGWIWNLEGVTPLPYRLPELLADPEGLVWVCEGEKDVDRLLAFGVVATCNSGGAGKWRVEISTCFAGRDVVIVPDNDEPGHRHAEDVAQKLAGIAARIRVLELLGLPKKGDVSDWLAAGGTCVSLHDLAVVAPDWQPPATEDRGEAVDDDAEIARLAKLKPLVYERERKAAAERLGITRVSMLDKLVVLERGDGVVSGQGKPLELVEMEPWPDPVDGAELLDALAKAIRRYVVLTTAEADAVAMWVVGAHRFTVFPIFPRLFVTAAEMQSGKTTLLDVLSQLVSRPLVASNITAAALFRTIDIAKPSLLLDEADSYAQESEELRGIINSGHRADGAVIRTVGDNFEPRSFGVFSPMAIAAIGDLAATIIDRSIVIRLRRRRLDEAIETLRLDHPPAELKTLARQAVRWTADRSKELAAADPAIPPAIMNRAADNWRPLLAIADLAGGEWPGRGRGTALILAPAGAEGSARVQLLSDIRAAFATTKGVDRLSSEALVDYLVSLEDRPWPEWGKAKKPISKTQVARLLKPLAISPGTIRLSDGSTPKGYYKDAFADAFARYLPSEDPPF